MEDQEKPSFFDFDRAREWPTLPRKNDLPWENANEPKKEEIEPEKAIEPIPETPQEIPKGKPDFFDLSSLNKGTVLTPLVKASPSPQNEAFPWQQGTETKQQEDKQARPQSEQVGREEAKQKPAELEEIFQNRVEKQSEVNEKDDDSAYIVDSQKQDQTFKAYASYDYTDETLAEDFAAEQQASKKLIKLNKQVMVLIASLVLVGGYFLYNKVFNKKYVTSTRQRKRPARESGNRSLEVRNLLVPLWDLTSQQIEDTKGESQLIKTLLKTSGRENPFVLPSSVLEDIQRRVEAQIQKESPPEMLNKVAYRATLVGILTSGKNILTLVDLKTAKFEVQEGSDKPKIIKAATKEMDRAKEDTVEMSVGDYLGPWRVIAIDPGKKFGSEASMTIERGGDVKILKIGQTIELGIFNDEGELDVYKD